MSKKGEEAKKLFLQGHNCAQAVLCAFAEDLGMEQAAARSVAACFGGGLGGQREVCGAVSGMCIALSLKYAPENPACHEEKKEFYRLIQEACGRFKEENGSIICRELLGLTAGTQPSAPQPRTKEYYKKRPCPEKVKSAADILYSYLKDNNTDK